ncbi:hypothetical protein AMTRI_Chr09g12370 [Amborella trichopoda]
MDLQKAKKRCVDCLEQLQSLPPSKISLTCKRSVYKLIISELKFLNSLSQDFCGPLSTNIGYLESIVYILQQPFINSITRVCKSVPLSSLHGKKFKANPKGVHIDIICTYHGNPVWFIVSDRNPKYISWAYSHRSKGLRSRLHSVIQAANSSLTLQPAFVIFFFANGLDEVVPQKLIDEYKALEIGKEFNHFEVSIFEELEDEWVNITFNRKTFDGDLKDSSRQYQGARVFQFAVNCLEKDDEGRRACVHSESSVTMSSSLGNTMMGFHKNLLGNDPEVLGNAAFCSLISTMQSSLLDGDGTEMGVTVGENMINFDTTALIALVSGISSGGIEQILKAPEDDMRKRFKSNFAFVMAQVKSEIENPILEELGCLISCRKVIICESVCSEFKELIAMCGGPGEKMRADRLLQCLVVIKDNPSARVVGLPTTRKIGLKNKIIFGTGDQWRAPTLTANMGFVRAVFQTGMSLMTLEHRPRALTGQ